jgi:hypothetical protein
VTGTDNFPHKAPSGDGGDERSGGGSGTGREGGRRRDRGGHHRRDRLVGRQAAVAAVRPGGSAVRGVRLIMAPPPDLDRALWFEPGCCADGRHYVHYNSHTFPGRMGAYCEAHDRTFSVWLPEIERSSPEARYWIRGFLAGNEPPRPLDADGYEIDDLEDVRWVAWREAIDHFRKGSRQN